MLQFKKDQRGNRFRGNTNYNNRNNGYHQQYNIRNVPKVRKDGNGYTLLPELSLAHDNFLEFERACIDRFGALYGRAVEYITKGKFERLSLPDPATENKTSLEIIAKSRINEHELGRQHSIKMYMEIWAQLSEESRHRIRTLPNFDTDIDPGYRVDLLWEAIKKTHFGTRGYLQTEAETKARLRDKFHECVQGRNEDLHTFYKRFQRVIETMDKYKVERPKDGEEIAVEFLNRISRGTYHDFLSHVSTQASVNQKYPFDSLHKAYAAASNFIMNKADHYGGSNRGRYPHDNSKRSSGEAVFAAHGGGRYDNRRNHNNGGGYRNNNRYQNTRDSEQEEVILDKSQSGCWICGEKDHRHAFCPQNPKNRGNNNSNGKAEQKGDKKKVMFIPPQALNYNDRDDDESEKTFFARFNTSDDDERCEVSMMFRAEPIANMEEEVISSCFKTDIKHIDNPMRDTVLYLDTGASTSIIRNMSLCENVRTANVQVRISGITGAGSRTNLVGDLAELGEVYILPSALANCLSYGALEEMFKIYTLEDQQGFIVKVNEHLSYWFKKTNKRLYACDLNDSRCIIKGEKLLMMETSEDRELEFSKRQVDDAKVARQWAMDMGFPSAAALMKLAKGFMKNAPVTAHDIYNSYKIYGPHPAEVRGKFRQVNPRLVAPEYVPKPVITDLIMYADIMLIASESYLITITKPLGLLMVTHMADRGTPFIAKALNSILKQYVARQFTIISILCDREGGLYKLKDDLADAGIVLDSAGAGSHVGMIEIQIKLLKEMFRSVLSALPYRLPKFLYRYLVYFCTSRRNMLPSNTQVDQRPPRELFTGRRVDYNIDVRIGFGKYVEIDAMHKHRNDATLPRTLPAISLDPKGNLQGSVRFFVLKDPVIDPATKGTNKEKLKYAFAFRDRWREMVVNGVVIDKMNEIGNNDKERPADMEDLDVVDFEDEGRLADELVEAQAEIREPNKGIEGEGHIPVDEVEDILQEVGEQDMDRISAPRPNYDLEDPIPIFSPPEQPAVETEISESPFALPGVESSDGVVAELPEQILPEEDIDTGQQEVEPRRRRQYNDGTVPIRSSRREVKPPNRFISSFMNMNIFRISFKKGIQKYGKRAIDAAMKELQQMLKQGVWSKVRKRDLAKIDWSMVITSFMFLKEKFFPDGSFDKLKMRLVGGGHKQNKLDYDDISSPTVLLTTVLIILVIAIRRRYVVVTTDIAGAYLNARIKNQNLYMRIDSTLAAILVDLDESYKDYLLDDGSLIVKLEKALYGCIESAKLWYELLAETLVEYGLIRSNYDPCLFYDLSRNIYVTIYVDDILIAAEKDEEVRRLLKYLEDKFKTITINEGRVISYLGMNIHLDYENEQVKITMDKYVDDVLQICGAEGNAMTPALSDLFQVDLKSPLLSGEEKEHFHSMVAKLLYLAKRVRPDILTTISFLATRVREPTVQDLGKLQRVCRYIRRTKDKCVILKASGDVVAYVDASHAVHGKDGRSHTGVYVTLGSGPIFVRSTKQKLTTKSSTEAELVALSDALPMILWVRELLIELGYMGKDKAVEIMEDNMSTIALVKRGSPSGESTRHINIRYFFITDRVHNKEIIITYCPTKSQLADYFTKPLVGAAHHDMVDLVMNHKEGTKPATMSESPGVFEE